MRFQCCWTNLLCPGKWRVRSLVPKSNYFSSSVCFAAKGYLARVKEDPKAVVCLGDSAYHRSSVKDKLGIGRPVPLPKDGFQQKV
jgi:hypothetical protein